jgi:hypothetical protein
MAATVWNGEPEDLVILQTACNHYCTCGEGIPTCPSHRLLTDQESMDRFAFVAAMRGRLKDSEANVIEDRFGEEGEG